MKQIVTIVGILICAVNLIAAQTFEKNEFTGRKAVKYRHHDPIAEKLDYSNTICDTLKYNGEEILLDESPLFQINDLLELILKYQNPLPEDSIYNCRRGYTAQWEIRSGYLFLKRIIPNKENYLLGEKVTQLPIVKNHHNTQLYMQKISGTIRGGSQTIKTNYGYAYKKEYIFTLESGFVKEVKVHEMSTGTLENKTNLQEYMSRHTSSLLDGGVLDSEFIQRIKAQTNRQGEKELLFNEVIPMTTDVMGETYFLPPSWRLNDRGSFEVDLTKHFEMKDDVNNLHFVHTLPRGSFYPRILRTGLIYQPTYVQFRYSLEKQILDADIHYFTPEINCIKDAPLLLLAQ